MSGVKTPPELSAVLEEEIARSGVPRGAQIDAVRELFELFTARRGGLGRWSYLDAPRLRLAYLRYHLPLNAARAECVLRDLLALRPEIGEIEHVVDLGAGPGSASVAALLTLPQRPRSFLLTDRSRAALRTARELLLRCAEKASAPAPAIRTVAQKLPALPRPVGKPCLLFLSMVINEISGPRGGMDLESLFARLERFLSPGSVAVLIEPALREPARWMLALRDQLLSRAGWRVIAPCTHPRACPLLAIRTRPWCHFHFRWQAGPCVDEIAASLGLRHEDSSFAYLVLERTGGGGTRAGDRADRARVIGDPMQVAGGGRGVYICRSGVRATLKRPPPGARRGDIIRVAQGHAGMCVIQRWPG